MTLSKPARLVLVGRGRWGGAYQRTIAGLPGVELIGSFGRDFSPSMLDRDDIDGVIVATPPATHASIAMAALERGLPVLIEKPLTLDPDEAHAILALASARGVLVMVEHTHLFAPAFRELKRRLRDGGHSIRRIYAVTGGKGPVRDDVSVLWDWGAHDIAMLLMVMGHLPREVSAIGEKREGVAHTVLRLRFTDDVHAHIDLSVELPTRRRSFSLETDRGTLTYTDTNEPRLTVDGRDIQVSSDRPLTVAVREFADAIAARRQDLSSLEMGSDVVAVLTACQNSLEKGHSIVL